MLGCSQVHKLSLAPTHPAKYALRSSPLARTVHWRSTQNLPLPIPSSWKIPENSLVSAKKKNAATWRVVRSKSEKRAHEGRARGSAQYSARIRTHPSPSARLAHPTSMPAFVRSRCSCSYRWNLHARVGIDRGSASSVLPLASASPAALHHSKRRRRRGPREDTP